MLRDYQQAALDAIVGHIKKSTLPCVCEAATGSGKSHIIAELAHWLLGKAPAKKVLCLAPSKELIEQNHEKYLATGNLASIFCASSGKKSLEHPVVFCSPLTTNNALDAINEFQVSAIVIDEAHGLTPTLKNIIKSVQEHNNLVRIVGLTATPYRMKTGYIYQINEKEEWIDESQAINPFFDKLVYRITAPELIEKGYLTPAVVGGISDSYAAASLKLNSSGRFDSKEVDAVFLGKGRLTADIVADIVAHSKQRNGVILFASTIAHAHEIVASLPQEKTRILTSHTPKNERNQIINSFKNQEIKYLVNVAVLTTGFDAPHVDVVAILRPTESAGLFQQIIGRGLRLSAGKTDCLVLDYAENIKRHKLFGDLFTPMIKTAVATKQEKIPVICPDCHYENLFATMKNPDEGMYTVKAGSDVYWIKGDDGLPLESANEFPVHLGRRCQHLIPLKNNPLKKEDFKQCEHRFNSKDCYVCSHPNDLTARYCSQCKAELVDPNKKLTIQPSKTVDLYQHIGSSQKVLKTVIYERYLSNSGNVTVKVEFQLENGLTALKYFSPEHPQHWKQLEYKRFMRSGNPQAVDVRIGKIGLEAVALRY